MATAKFGFDIKGYPNLNSRPEHIKQVAEASLKRLRLDATFFTSTGLIWKYLSRMLQVL
jgi:hypothetical protein